MKTKIKGDYVVADTNAIPALYETGYFGRPKDGKLYLRFTEAAYLLFKNKITILNDKKEMQFDEFFKFAALKEDFFELKYIVYKDLKERGYYVQSSTTDFRIYPRGGHPGKTAAKSFVYVRSERIPISFPELISQINNAQNVRKQFVLAIVDEESDITFYDVKRTDAAGKFEGDMETPFPPEISNISVPLPLKATLFKERVILENKEAADIIYKKAFFGKMMDDERLLLSLPEAAYLEENGVLNLYDMEENPLEKFIDKSAEIDSEFEKKYTVYKELKDRGFVPKTGFKFGTHFRVYRKIESLDKIPHSEFLLHVISPDYEFKLPATSGAIRLANSVRKRMIYAADIGTRREYIEFERIKM